MSKYQEPDEYDFDEELEEQFADYDLEEELSDRKAFRAILPIEDDEDEWEEESWDDDEMY